MKMSITRKLASLFFAGFVGLAFAAQASPTRLPETPTLTRAEYARTVLPDGSLLFSGGVDGSGRAVATLELFEPVRQASKALSVSLLEARRGHAAAVLTDGRVIFAGGVDARGQPLLAVELYDPIAQTVDQLPSLLVARINPVLRLLPSGNVLVTGGTDGLDTAVTLQEMIDSKTGTVVSYTEALRQENEVRFDAVAPAVAEILPPHESRDVDVDDSVAVRFSRRPLEGTVDSGTITLFGPSGAVPSNVVTTQDGMLAFVNPRQSLLPDSRYSLFVQGLLDEARAAIPFTVSSFTTKRLVREPAAPLPVPVVEVGPPSTDPSRVHPLAHLRWNVPEQLNDSEVFTPDFTAMETGDWKDRRGVAKSALGPLPVAQPGVTALAGRVLRLNGEPLANVTVKVGTITATSDEQGTFLLEGLRKGPAVLDVDASTASNDSAKYGRHLIRIVAKQGETVQLGFDIWLSKLDPRGTVRISSPTTEETVLSTPAIPGLEVHIPAGVVIRDLDGKIVTELNLSAIPVNRPPFPLPSLAIPVFFSVQPGGALLQGTSASGGQGAQIHYPNYNKLLPNSRTTFFNYDPVDREWFVYGEGQVDQEGKHVVPDPGVAVYQFTGAMFDSDPPAPPAGPPPDCNGGPNDPPKGNGPQGNGPGSNGPRSDDKNNDQGKGGPDGPDKKTGTGSGGSGCPKGADPVSLSTGYFLRTETDVFLPDVESIALARIYRSQDSGQRAFGIGWTTTYDVNLYSQNEYQEVDLILADGGRVHFVRTSPGTSYTDAVFTSTAPGPWAGAMIWRNNSRAGWDLIFRNGAKWHFPQYQRLTELVDPNGNTTTIVRRDSNGTAGPMTRIVSPNGRYIDFTLDSAGRITQARDSAGRVTTYSYDASGRLAKVVDPMLHEHNYTYDTAHRLVTVQDPRGVVGVTNQYDANRRVTLQTLADSSTFQFAYTVASGRVVATDVTDQRGKVRHVEFDSDGYISSSTASYGTTDAQTNGFVRDSAKNLVSITDSRGRVTKMTYDALGNTLTVTRLFGTTDAQTMTYGYDQRGANVTSMTDPLSHTVSFTYDAYGNLLTEKDALNNTTTYTRDSQGRVATRTNPLGKTWAYAYDGPDLVSVTSPLGRSTRLVRDAAGNQTSIADSLGNTWTYEYDLRGRVTRLIDPTGSFEQFAYDQNGNVLSHTDQIGNTTSYTYNALSGVASKTDPNAKTETYVYGANGQISQITDRKGQISAITFDGLNRAASKKFGATIASPTAFVSTVTYGYDTGNRVTSIVDSASGTITRTFDELDRLTEEQTSQGNVTYGYDAANRRTTMEVGGESSVTYTWDDADRLVGVTKGSETSIFAYDVAGRRVSATLPNGVVATYGYDDANQLTSISYAKNGTLIGDLFYTYDAVGRRQSVGGTLAAVDLPASVGTVVLGPGNRLTTWGGVTLAYDLNGNLTSDGIYTYTWDERDQLTSMSGSPGAGLFTYDGLGRRVGKVVAGLGTAFAFDGDNFVQESPTAGAQRNLVVAGLDQVLARSDGSTSSYPLTDAFGNVLGLTSSAGVLQTQYAYEPYGKSRTIGAASTNSQTFASREDDGLGLTYMRARYYSPSLHRFISEDPIGILSQEMNPYVYAKGAPTRYADPYGTWVFLLALGAGGGSGISATGLAAGAAGLAAGIGLGWLGSQAINSQSNGNDKPPTEPPKIPDKWDGKTPPAPGWEWRGPDEPGGARGGWVSPDGKESLHNDPDHGGKIGPHVDWNDRDGGRWRLYPDGRCERK